MVNLPLMFAAEEESDAEMLYEEIYMLAVLVLVPARPPGFPQCWLVVRPGLACSAAQQC